MGFFSKVWKGVKKVASPVLKVASVLAPANPWLKAGTEIFSAYNANKQSQDNASQQFQNDQASAYAQMQFQDAMAAKQMEFQTASNAKQMEFQERMSNTSHQREVTDLKSAGLNPILSGTGGMGASSPAGSTAIGSAPSGAKANASKADLVDVGSTALQMARTQAEIERIEAEKEYIRAQTETEKQRPANVQTDTIAKNATANAQQALSGLYGQQNINAGVDKELKDLDVLIKKFDLQKLKPAEAEKLRTSIDILKEEYKTARRLGDMNDTEYAKAIGYIKMLTDAIPVVGTAKLK